MLLSGVQPELTQGFFTIQVKFSFRCDVVKFLSASFLQVLPSLPQWKTELCPTALHSLTWLWVHAWEGKQQVLLARAGLKEQVWRCQKGFWWAQKPCIHPSLLKSPYGMHMVVWCAAAVGRPYRLRFPLPQCCTPYHSMGSFKSF